MRAARLKDILAGANANHAREIMKEPTLKDAHIYCVIYNVSAQQYGPLLEKYIIARSNYKKNKASDCTGDCATMAGNKEIKASLGGARHSKFNFVQLRLSHDTISYLLTAYHLAPDNVEREGDLYVFDVPKEAIRELIVAHGGYAHGTIRENGKITAETIDEKKEYAIRPSFGDACWQKLMAFRV
jgi:hypothetical protein